MILIAGPCVIESEALTLEIAIELKKQLASIPGLDFWFKASFDKANRTSVAGFRGPGLEKGLKILDLVRSKTGLRILTDFHTPEQADPVAEVADALQVPAFLCRQTDLIAAGARAAARHHRMFNIKKGQFLAPWDAKNIVEKCTSSGLSLDQIALTERGVAFGYNSLVVDMTSFQIMKELGVSVIYDATHSIQKPGAGPDGKSTGGNRNHLEVLARAAAAAGADGIFMEVHPDPARAKSDGPNAFYLDLVGAFVAQIKKIKELSDSLPRVLKKELKE